MEIAVPEKMVFILKQAPMFSTVFTISVDKTVWYQVSDMYRSDCGSSYTFAREPVTAVEKE